MTNNRNINFFKQIKLSLVYKIFSIIFSFLLLKYMVEYLGVELYGIWSVLLVFINWIIFFDFGIVNGLKNKISESISENKIDVAVKFISTGYIVIFIFSILFFILFYIVSFWINWQTVFNVSYLINSDLRDVVLVTIAFILINFVFSVITAVFNATQKASLIVLNQFLSQGMALFLVILLNMFSSANLMYLAIAYGVSLLFSSSILTVFFYKKHISLRPSIGLFDKEKIKSIMSLGLKFFFLQLTILLILSSDKIIIVQLLGASDVTKYEIIFKYFSVITLIHGLVNMPLWPMYTEAYVKNDFTWIEKTLKKMFLLYVALILISFFMCFIADSIIRLWIGETSLIFSFSNYIYMSIMMLSLVWFSTYANFTNGIDKVRVQMIASLVGAVLNIPLSIWFVSMLDMGLNGILLATIISLSIFGIFGPLQAISEIKKMKVKLNK